VPSPPPPWGALWREHRTAALGLFALAFAVRVLLLVQIGGTPYVEVGNIDSVAYQGWAARILDGGWRPRGTFYQSPLYAYFLAVVYSIAGDGPWAPRVIQILAGSVSPVLLYAIGTTLFSRRVGWIAGVLLALYGPIILEEITLSKTTLLITTALAAVGLYLRAAPTARLRGLGAAGLLFGAGVIGVGQWILAFVALIPWVAVMAAHLPREQRLRATAVFAAGGLAIILPMAVWNSVHGGGVVLTSGDAGLNFFTGNNERASGLPASPIGLRDTPQYEEADGRALAEQAVGRPLSPSEVARYWTWRGLRWIAANPGAWVALLGKKLATLWNGFEIPDNYHYAFMRTHFLPLLWTLPTFALVAPLALVGLVMPFWRRRDVTALYVVTFAYLATILMFYVRSRYRLQAVPFLIAFAAVAVDRAMTAIAERRWTAVGALAGGLAVAAGYTNRQYCEPEHHGMRAVCLGGDTWFDTEWLKLAEWHRNAGRLDEAVAYALRATECRSPRSPGSIATWIAELGTMRTEQLVREGRRDLAEAHFTRAEEQYRRALALGHRVGSTQSNLGSLYVIYGKPEEAIAAFEAAQASVRLDRPAQRRLARAYVDVGRCADAEGILAQLDREQGLGTPSDETRAILSACGPGR
jgi:4-amino-4-deoxy-L-arabinose transferase-like glycosyltransferase